MRHLLAFLIIGMAGCASTQQITTETPLYKYRAQMEITVNGVTFPGMAVTKSQPALDISIKSNAELDRVQITSCARQNICENKGNCDPQFKMDRGWFGDAGNTMIYHYYPTALESSQVCPLYIEAYAKDLLTDWGYVAFRTDETLPATMDCNGEHHSFAGISVCQTKAGLDQFIGFDRSVKFAADTGCTVNTVNSREFTVRGSPGFCYAEFSDGKIWHRLILLGYDQVLVRVK